jgi:hypothetical protein
LVQYARVPKAAKNQFSKVSTTEKGIGQIGPSKWETGAVVDREPNASKSRHGGDRRGVSEAAKLVNP